MLRAANPRGGRLQVAQSGAEIEGAPAAPAVASIVGATVLAADSAAAAFVPLGPDPDDQRSAGFQIHAFHHRPLQPQQANS